MWLLNTTKKVTLCIVVKNLHLAKFCWKNTLFWRVLWFVCMNMVNQRCAATFFLESRCLFLYSSRRSCVFLFIFYCLEPWPAVTQWSLKWFCNTEAVDLSPSCIRKGKNNCQILYVCLLIVLTPAERSRQSKTCKKKLSWTLTFNTKTPLECEMWLLGFLLFFWVSHRQSSRWICQHAHLWEDISHPKCLSLVNNYHCRIIDSFFISNGVATLSRLMDSINCFSGITTDVLSLWQCLRKLTAKMLLLLQRWSDLLMIS